MCRSEHIADRTCEIQYYVLPIPTHHACKLLLNTHAKAANLHSAWNTSNLPYAIILLELGAAAECIQSGAQRTLQTCLVLTVPSLRTRTVRETRPRSAREPLAPS